MIRDRVVTQRFFALIDLLCVSTAVILWEMQPRLEWWPLLLALLPWFLRLSAGSFPFRRTGLELPLAVFMLTAMVGVWAAYGQDDARAKFWLLVAGILLYYALAGQPKENLWPICWFLSLVGVGVAVFFLLTHNWESSPAKIVLLNRIGLQWMEARPDLGIQGIHHNTAGGMIALTAPFTVALAAKAWREKRALLGLWVIAAVVLSAAAFSLATSRGAALALAVGLGLWLWWASSKRLRHTIPLRPTTIYAIGLLALVIMGIGFTLFYPGDPIDLADAVPGPPSAGSRVELAESAIDLVGDFPFTGGGLNSFPGLFPAYIHLTPYYITLNSHNLFLDVALEQGIPGLVAFVMVYAGSFWMIGTRGWRSPQSTLLWATLISLLIAMLHGLTDTLVYGRWGAALVFLIPGLAFAVDRSQPKLDVPSTSTDPSGRDLGARILQRRWMFPAIAVAIVPLLAVGAANRDSLRAAWYADLGAVRMAKADLAGFPPAYWPVGSNLARLGRAEAFFIRALRHDSRSRTANYRLGLIASGRQDFSTALSYLTAAYDVDNDHRGIRKALGYNLVWARQLDQALVYLKELPEASDEMKVYVWWWTTQDRKDVARRAREMESLLKGADSKP